MSIILKKPEQVNNIGFISTRISGTDGVSLEIAKWSNVLQRNRFNCFYFAGELDRDASVCHLCELAHFEHPEIDKINMNVFGTSKRSSEISLSIQNIKEKIKQELHAFQKKYDIDLIIPENALSIPLNLPLGLAITEFIAEQNIPAIAHHHDFYWERDRFLINACQDYIHTAFPPDLSRIQHVVINSLASEQLSHRLGISNTVTPNIFDFAHPPEPPDNYLMDLRHKIGLREEDLFILQPTRIVPRKWIERSIEIVSGLDLSNPTLIISHASGDEGDEYYLRIKEYARNLGVNIAAIDHLINDQRSRRPDGTKLYTIGDVYRNADIVTYPSGYEGFGNAFLETIYYKKPIIVNRYSIFIADIEPKGFDVLGINGFVTSRIINQIKEVLHNKKKCEEMVEKNYQLANRFFSYEILEEKLMSLIDTLVSM